MKGVALHESHSLLVDARTGYWLCWTCGAVAKSVVRELARPCPRTVTGNGADNLSRLDKGLYPGTGPEARAYNEQLRKGRVFDTGVVGRLGGFRAAAPGASRSSGGPRR